MSRIINYLMLFLWSVIMISCGKKVIESKADAMHVTKQVEKFAPVTIQYSENLLDENETAALKKIVEAAKYMDEIFLRQVYENNVKIREVSFMLRQGIVEGLTLVQTQVDIHQHFPELEIGHLLRCYLDCLVQGDAGFQHGMHMPGKEYPV